MRRRTRLVLLGLVFVAGGSIGWYLFRPERLFVDTVVHEDFPIVAAQPPMMLSRPMLTSSSKSATSDSAAAGAAMSSIPESAKASPTQVPAPTQMPAPTQVPAPTAVPEPVVLARGRFHSVVHEGEGLATIYQLPDGRRLLRFTEFDVLNGPDLYVYMVAAPDAQDSASVKQAGYVSLGLLKGNVGDQNYELPADLDLSTYRSVSIWCQRFSVNFATAPLE